MPKYEWWGLVPVIIMALGMLLIAMRNGVSSC